MLMKNLTLVMLGFAVSTFVVSTFSMNLPLPFGLGKKFWAFWFVMSIVLSFVIVFIVFLRKKKW
jgi:Mg2+ and Co2+ transporter CorA